MRDDTKKAIEELDGVLDYSVTEQLADYIQDRISALRAEELEPCQCDRSIGENCPDCYAPHFDREQPPTDVEFEELVEEFNHPTGEWTARAVPSGAVHPAIQRVIDCAAEVSVITDAEELAAIEAAKRAVPVALVGWLGDLAYRGCEPRGELAYTVNRFGEGAIGNPSFSLDFAELQSALRDLAKEATDGSLVAYLLETLWQVCDAAGCPRDAVVAREKVPAKLADLRERLAKAEHAVSGCCPQSEELAQKLRDAEQAMADMGKTVMAESARADAAEERAEKAERDYAAVAQVVGVAYEAEGHDVVGGPVDEVVEQARKNRDQASLADEWEAKAVAEEERAEKAEAALCDHTGAVRDVLEIGPDEPFLLGVEAVRRRLASLLERAESAEKAAGVERTRAEKAEANSGAAVLRRLRERIGDRTAYVQLLVNKENPANPLDGAVVALEKVAIAEIDRLLAEIEQPAAEEPQERDVQRELDDNALRRFAEWAATGNGFCPVSDTQVLGILARRALGGDS